MNQTYIGLLIIGIFSAYAVQSQHIVWQQAYGTSETDFGFNLVKSNDEYTILGSKASVSYLIHTDYQGNVLWEKGYSNDINDAFAKTENGYILGGSYLLYLTNSGDSISVYSEYPFIGENSLNNILPDEDCTVFTTSASSDNVGIYKICNGIFLWEQPIYSRKIIKFETNYLSIRDSLNFFILTLINPAGTIMQEKYLESDTIYTLRDIIYGTDKNIYILGSDFNTHIIKLDSKLNLLWEKSYSYVSFPEVLSQTKDYSIVVAGTSIALDQDIHVSRITQDGDYIWGFQLFRPIGDESIRAAVVDCDTSIVLCGYGENGPIGGFDILLTKVDSMPGLICIPSILYEKDEVARVYPNPAHQEVEVNFFDNVTGQFAITSISGQFITSGSLSNACCLTISTYEYAQGIYLITFFDSNKFRTLKFVKL